MFRNWSKFGKVATINLSATKRSTAEVLSSPLCAYPDVHGLSPVYSEQLRHNSSRQSRLSTLSRPAMILRPCYRLFNQGVVSCHKTGQLTCAAANTAVNLPTATTASSESQNVEAKAITTVDAEKTLHRLYETYPELEEYDHSAILPYLESMIAQSISVDSSVEILLKYPTILQRDKYDQKVPSILSTLRGMGLSEKQRKALLHEKPGLIDLSRSHLNKRMAFLKSWFSDSEALDVIINSVETLTDHETILKQKLQYLVKSASHETKSIVKTKTLSFPLSRMKSRHEFLIRCGLFKAIPYNKMIKIMEKNKAAKDQRDKYFPPNQIVCLSDKDFLKCCTKNSLTVNELAAFEELYAVELENDVDDEDENNELSSDEEDDEGYDPESLMTINSGGFSNKAESDQFYF